MVIDEGDRPPTDPAQALRLIRDQQAHTARRIHPDLRLYYLPWGLTWLVGFLLFFLRFGPDGRVLVDMPDALPLIVLNAGLVVSAILSATAGARLHGQVVGDSPRRARWYQLGWLLGFAGLFAVNLRVAPHLPVDLANLLWAASSVALTGALYLAGAAIWLDRRMFVLGGWITVTNIAGVVAGPGWHALVVAVAAGGGMLVAGAVVWLRQRSRA
jgi:hypothetical protein